MLSRSWEVLRLSFSNEPASFKEKPPVIYELSVAAVWLIAAHCQIIVKPGMVAKKSQRETVGYSLTPCDGH